MLLFSHVCNAVAKGGEGRMNIRSAFMSALTLVFVLTPGIALAQGSFGDPVAAPTGTQSAPLPTAIINILNGLLVIAALAALVFLIIGGFRYIFSQGDEDQTTAAKNTILYAIIGLIVIALAATVINFVSNAVGTAGP